MNPLLDITVVSDLHCKHSSSDKNKDGISMNSTILYSDLLRNDNSPIHPVHALLRAIEKNPDKFKSDLLLCPGDITDKVDAQGYLTGWTFLEEIKSAIGANHLVATIGNHDVDSRRRLVTELPFFLSRSIKKNYPIAIEDLQNDFWNNHFCIFEGDDYLVLIFNSAYTHVSATDAAKSEIKEDILKKMEEQLQKVPENKIKVALCHHHPLNHSNTDYQDSDVIKRGELLLEVLDRFGFTILIHGHKHEIKVRYYNSLIVFCAGSFSSTENIRITDSENVFHQIQFFENKKGLIKTWIYGATTGWVLKSGKKNPAIFGFGFRGDIEDLAKKVSDWLNSKNGVLEKYQTLINDIPDVQYLLPHEQDQLQLILKTKFSVEITYDSLGLPAKISKILLDD